MGNSLLPGFGDVGSLRSEVREAERVDEATDEITPGVKNVYPARENPISQNERRNKRDTTRQIGHAVRPLVS
jgi:hypothetical protein